MSSIIDALKKSDKNRNTEDTSSVNQIKFSDEKSHKSRKGFWILVILLLFIAGGVLAWQQGWHHSIIAKTKSLLGSDEQTTKPKIAKPKTDKPSQVIDQEKRRDTQNKLVPPKTNEVKDRSAAAKKRLQNKIDEKTKRNVTTVNNPKEKTETEPESTENTTENTTDEIVAIKKKKEKQQNTETVPNKELEPQLKQDHLLVHQIPFEIRKNIPPIKLNIHIYDPEPENRMILLNGVKYGVGDVIEELVEIKDITKEGVVLKFETVEFLVPK